MKVFRDGVPGYGEVFMKAEKILVCLLACSIIFSICGCKKKNKRSTVKQEAPTDTYTDTYSPPPTATPKPVQDYSSPLKDLLGVEPASSTFAELKRLSNKIKDNRAYYNEDEEHHYCTLVFKGNLYYVIRYEMAQQWFEYFFRPDDNLYFETFNGNPIIREEDYCGPEGMYQTSEYRVFVDDSCKFLVLCDNLNIPDYQIEAFNGDGYEEQYVSVERFKEYYSLNDTEIEDYLIEDYIWINRIDEYELAKEDHGEWLKLYIECGSYEKFGYYLLVNQKAFSRDTTRSVEEFIKDAKWVYFEFEFRVPDSKDTKTENIVFDIRHNKVYFNANPSDYREAEVCVELDADAYNMLCEELPNSVGPDDGNKYHDLEYSYYVLAIDADGEYMEFTSYARNSVNACFDVFWRELYKECFGKEYVLDPEGADLEHNMNRRLYHSKEPTLEF